MQKRSVVGRVEEGLKEKGENLKRGRRVMVRKR